MAELIPVIFLENIAENKKFEKGTTFNVKSVFPPRLLHLYPARLSATVRRRAFRFLIASRSPGVDQGLVYRPVLDFPTWSFAAARMTELKRWTLSPNDKGAVENSSIASSVAAENEFDVPCVPAGSALGRRGRRYFAPDGGRDGRWSELRSSHTVHSVPVDQALVTAVMSGVLRPPVPRFTHVAVQSLRVLAFWDRNQSSTSSPHLSAGWCSSHSGELALRLPPARKRFPGSVGARARVS